MRDALLMVNREIEVKIKDKGRKDRFIEMKQEKIVV
jgi:hypothetical protein